MGILLLVLDFFTIAHSGPLSAALNIELYLLSALGVKLTWAEKTFNKGL